MSHRLIFINKNPLKNLVIIGSIAAAFLMCIQGYWLTKAFDANAAEFDHTVSVALYNVADTMSEQASVEKRSSNYFFVTTNSPLSHQKVDTMIQKEFSARNILLDYEIGVYNAEDDSLVYGNYVKAKVPRIQIAGCEEIDRINKNFAILFPTRKSYLIGQVDTWVFITFGLILLSSSCFYWIAYASKSPVDSLAKQNQIRLGNSCLDFHNQNLVVHDTSYRLTYKENQILKLLFENPNQVISREVFLSTIWKKDGFFVARSMDVFISKTRKYLGTDQALKIENLRSIGYRLRVSK
ncbi:MAG: winged helix-turn-helix domain-containing protein [Cytophagales bacterium]|nr:winged helix-turn-helix domain-containing protein [Cytophagales bacterium]